MPLPDEVVQAAALLLRNSRAVLVVSHIRPDGDAIGSLIGMGLGLQEAGKQTQMVLEDGLPSSYRHLHGSDLVRTRPEGAFDTIVVVDCSDLERTGNALRGLPQPDLNIDHHQTNLNFARLNLVDTRAVATAELVYAILKEMQVKITPDIARALLTGVITDTIGFRTSNVGADTLRLAAELIEAGADLPDLYRRALVNRSFEAFRYWGAGLSKLNQEGRLVWTALTLEDRKAANYAGRDDADLINQLGAVENSDVAIVFVEQSKKRVKVSWRAQPGYDVSAIALRFGGGGHPAASGAEVDGRMEEVIEKVLQATRPILNGKTPRTGRDSLS